MKTSFLLLFTILISLNCTTKKSVSPWVEKGDIQMDKLISLDSLWENRNELKGNVITIELDTINTVANGKTGFINGVNYYCVYFGLNSNKLGIEWNDIKSYLKKSNITYTKNDTLDLGYYGINIINQVDDNVSIPDWVNYNKPYIQFDRESDIYKTANSSQKYITGVVLHYRTKYNGNNELFKLLLNQNNLLFFHSVLNI